MYTGHNTYMECQMQRPRPEYINIAVRTTMHFGNVTGALVRIGHWRDC